MILTEEIYAIMGRKRLSGKQLAARIGMAPKNFYANMKKRSFRLCDMEALIRELEIQNPGDIFFANLVPKKETTEMK